MLVECGVRMNDDDNVYWIGFDLAFGSDITVQDKWEKSTGRHWRKIGCGDWEEIPNPLGMIPFVVVEIQ